jgi:hypothetical protein
LASTVGEIEQSVVYRIVMVPVGVALSATLYSLWTGVSWLRSVAFVVSIVALVIAIQWISRRRREG